MRRWRGEGVQRWRRCAGTETCRSSRFRRESLPWGQGEGMGGLPARPRLGSQEGEPAVTTEGKAVSLGHANWPVM